MRSHFFATCRATLASILLLMAAGARADHLRNVKPGEPVPEFSLKSIEGDSRDNASLRGKVAMLVFLSAEQSSSERAAEAAHGVLAKVRHDDLRLVFITADAAEVAYFRQQRDKTNVHDPLLLDIDRVFYGKLGVIVMPTTIGVDREGKLAFVISGYKSDYAHVLETRSRLALGDIDEAEAEKRLTAETFQRDRPADRAARHRASAQLLREKGLLADAEKELKSAIAADPANADAALDLASLYLRQKKPAEAGALVDGVLKADPSNRRGKMMLGIVLLVTGDLAQAETLLQEALLLNPDPARTHYYLGVLFEKKGDKDKALGHYREALVRVLDEPQD